MMYLAVEAIRNEFWEKEKNGIPSKDPGTACLPRNGGMALTVELSQKHVPPPASVWPKVSNLPVLLGLQHWGYFWWCVGGSLSVSVVFFPHM